MKNKIIKLAGLAITCMALTACDTEFSNPVGDSSSYSSGDADFSHFVAIGDSLTAGYADNALYLHGQENSYPAILAQQFGKVGGGSFKQPLVSDNLGGLLIDGVFVPVDPADPQGPKKFDNRLVLDAEAESAEPIEGDPTTEVFDLQTGAFNNMGVPGAKSFHLLSTDYGNSDGLATGTANPYFVRFASAPDTSMIADAAAQQPSFFVMWVGNNDALSYASSGGTGTNQTDPSVDPGDYESNDLTNPIVFGGIYKLLVGAIKGANPDVKGVLVNIPDTLPFFTTVPYNPVPFEDTPVDKLKVAALNLAYAEYNGGLQAALGLELIDAEEAAQRTITFEAGKDGAVTQNAVVILDKDLTDLSGLGLPSMRQATAEDFLLLTTSSKIGEPVDPLDPASKIWGVSAPLEDSDVLTSIENQIMQTTRLAYNDKIKAIADADPNLLYHDIDSFIIEMDTSGIDYGTGFIDTTYATGGAFSLDGIHFTARGYAAVANTIIDTINTGFNANIPAVDPGAYTTIFVK